MESTDKFEIAKPFNFRAKTRKKCFRKLGDFMEKNPLARDIGIEEEHYENGHRLIVYFWKSKSRQVGV